uniref:NADH dehydrogenase subunit 6 n=1 Tax=Proasellus coxalis TaxID=63229 RepID=A0A485M7J5_9CRUS|nr:NADH dehydrogenase subunit 6 [Proasellus coxalis]
MILLALFIMSGLFLASKTPHILIASLLTSTLLAAIFLGSVKSFPWLAYILFLVFLGGVLILFTYISSLSSNPLFKKVKLEILAPMGALALITLLMSDPAVLTETAACLGGFSSTGPLVKDLFSPLVYPLYLFLFIYLLITLLYVVTVMKTYYAPLRKTL